MEYLFYIEPNSKKEEVAEKINSFVNELSENVVQKGNDSLRHLVITVSIFKHPIEEKP